MAHAIDLVTRDGSVFHSRFQVTISKTTGTLFGPFRSQRWDVLTFFILETPISSLTVKNRGEGGVQRRTERQGRSPANGPEALEISTDGVGCDNPQGKGVRGLRGTEDERNPWAGGTRAELGEPTALCEPCCTASSFGHRPMSRRATSPIPLPATGEFLSTTSGDRPPVDSGPPRNRHPRRSERERVAAKRSQVRP